MSMSPTRVIHLRGEMDVNQYPQLIARMEALVEYRPAALHINLAGVKSIDSTGLALLIDTMQKVRGYGGEVFLKEVPENIRRILEMARLDQVFTID